MNNNFFIRPWIIEKIKNGACFFTPTDTISGLICKNIETIYHLKQREKTKSIIMFISGYDLIPGLLDKEKKLLDKFWPGELTIIKNGISYRVPNDKKLIKIIMKTGPLFCSSANISNQPVINDYKEAKKTFGNDVLYITNKFKGSNVPSTIFNLDSLTFIREGKITNDIKDYLKNNF